MLGNFYQYHKAGVSSIAGKRVHVTIHKKLFTAVKKLILCGCNVNETYYGGTPLRAALMCGRSNSGDVRIVNLLLKAKAQVDIQTVGGIETFFPEYEKILILQSQRTIAF